MGELSRAVEALKRPEECEPLNDFPYAVTSRSRYRAHRRDLGPWWFASVPATPTAGGRFDLVDPSGSCYVADSVEVAVRERLGPRAGGLRWLPDGPLLADTAVSVLAAAARPRRGRLANLIHSRASGWVTREINISVNYELTQEWAAAFEEIGFAGVRYEPRFSTGASSAEAWFGPAGGHALPADELVDWRDHLPSPPVAHIRVRRAKVVD